MDTPKYGDTLNSMYIKYQPIFVVFPKVYGFDTRAGPVVEMSILETEISVTGT